MLHVIVGLLGLFYSTCCAAAPGLLELTVIERGNRDTMPVQFQLQNGRGRRVLAPELKRDGSWQLLDGRAVLRLPPGDYFFRMRRGLEYHERSGQFHLQSGAADQQEVDLPRIVTMRDEGWYAGDLLIQVPALELPLRVLASDIHWAPYIVSTNPRPGKATSPSRSPSRAVTMPAGAGRLVEGVAQWDRRADGGVVVLEPSPRLDFPVPTTREPSSRGTLVASKLNATAKLYLPDIAAWDVPLWIALRPPTAIGILPWTMTDRRARSSGDDPSIRPRDRVLYPDPLGAGEWRQRIYFHLLETGHRIAPGAGSGSGIGADALGTQRVYVQCGTTLDATTWWEGLREGRVFVTNGPLLRVRANDAWSGRLFRVDANEARSFSLDLALQLATADKIEYLEVVQNGRPVQHVRLAEFRERKGRMAPVAFPESGWMLVRVVADDPQAFKGALSGPFFVEVANRPRISRGSAKFFLDWLDEYAATKKEMAITEEVDEARAYWQAIYDRATVD